MTTQNVNGSLEIRFISSRAELKEIFKVRYIVFIQEQKVDRKIEFDGLDNQSLHVIVKFGRKTIGCARIRQLYGKIKLERIAVLKEYRKKGIGKKLLRYLIKYCQQSNDEIVINAQDYLRDFYKELGFKTRGEPFIEAGIKHIEMYMINKDKIN